jgi:hypothetical protein
VKRVGGSSRIEHLLACVPSNAACLTAPSLAPRSHAGAPTADEMGFAKEISVMEIGGSNCVVLQQDSSMGNIATIVLRGR